MWGKQVQPSFLLLLAFGSLGSLMLPRLVRRRYHPLRVSRSHDQVGVQPIFTLMFSFSLHALLVSPIVLDMTNRWMLLVPVLFATLATSAVSPVASQESNKGTVVIGSLMWTIESNGQNVNWEAANKYCQSVRLGGYGDWRLPTIDELQAVYDPKATTVFHIKSPLQLKSCCLWSSTVLVEDGDKRRRFEPSRYAWGLYFDSGGVRYYSAMNFTDGQVLCVRPAK